MAIFSGGLRRRLLRTELRIVVWPNNFGIQDRCGTDAAIHLLQHMSDNDLGKVILSIDGVGAFDHICRARMFEQLLADRSLHGLVPFVHQWYGVQSHFKWKNDNGEVLISCRATEGSKTTH